MLRDINENRVRSKTKENVGKNKDGFFNKVLRELESIEGYFEFMIN